VQRPELAGTHLRELLAALGGADLEARRAGGGALVRPADQRHAELDDRGADLIADAARGAGHVRLLAVPVVLVRPGLPGVVPGGA
jgi:hypothetical protein